MLAAACGYVSGTVPVVRPLLFACFVILSVGLLSSILHLGKPMKAWRAFLGWRASWLSREIIALNAFCGATLAALANSLATTSRWAPLLRTEFFLFPAAIVGLMAVFASAMVYVDTQRAFWRSRLVFGSFFGTMLLLGSTFTAVVLAGSGGPLIATQTATLVAAVVRTALFIWRQLELHHASRDPTSPIHFNARVVGELLPRTTSLSAILFLASTCFGLVAIANPSLAWPILAALTTFVSELVARYVFFAASASKRMPGGIAA
jgi:DMSO reductase anchor subunit